MDYNWLENVPSSNTPIPVYQPDFGFLQSMQMRANMQYQQGLTEVKNAYSSIFNQPVTGDQAVMRQKEYARQAQDQMKDVSASDLSNPKNVQIADNIMAPFYEDRGLLTNIAYTRDYNSNVQKIQSGLFSTDDKQRALFDPIQLQDQEGFKSDLAEAGVDMNKLSRVGRRPVIPFHDIRSYLNEAAGKQGLQINWDEVSPDGQYIVTTTNGQRALGNFKTFARTVLSDPALQGQFQTYGRVARDNAKRHIMEQYPGIGPDQLNAKIADYTIGEMDRNYKEQIGDYNTQVLDLQNQLNDIKAKATIIGKNGKPRITDAMAPVYKQISDYKDMLERTGKNIGNEYSDFLANKEIKRQSITADPTGYFAKLQMNNVVNNFAAEKASQEGRKLTTNEAYFKALSERRLSAELSLNQAKFSFEQQKFMQEHKYDEPNFLLEGKKVGLVWNGNTHKWEHDPEWLGAYGMPGTGKGGAGGAGVFPWVESGTTNVDATGFKAVKDQYDNYNAGINASLGQAENLYWSPTDGMAAAIVNTPVNVNGQVSKLTIDDVDLTKTALQKKALDPNYKYTANELVALKRTCSALGSLNYGQPSSPQKMNGPWAPPAPTPPGQNMNLGNGNEWWAGTSQVPNQMDYDSPEKMLSLLEGKVRLNEKNQDGTPTIQSQKLGTIKAQADQLLQTALSKRKELNTLVESNILGNSKENADLLVDDKSRMVTPDDLTHNVNDYIGSIPLKDGTVITADQLAKAYYSGNFDYATNVVSLTDKNNLKYIKIGDRKIKMSDIDLDKFNKQLDNLTHNPYTYDPESGDNMADYQIDLFVNHMKDRYGQSDDFASKRRRIQNEVVNQVPGYANASGLRGVNISYNGDVNPVQNSTKNYISNALSIVSNRNADGIYGDDQKPLEPSKIKALDAILKDPDQYILSTDFLSFGGKDGHPVVQVTFRPELKNNDKTVIAGTSISDFGSMSRVNIEIDENTENPVLRKLLQSTGIGAYADMREENSRHTVKYGSNVIQKAHGFDATVYPSDFVNGKATRFTIVGTAKILDPNTGNLVPVEITQYAPNGQQTGDRYTGEFNKMTPAQVMEMINKAYEQFYATNINNYKIYKSKQANAPSFEEMTTQHQ